MRRRSTSLAQSRFDWERVLRELAIVIPEDIWLTQLTATVNPEVQLSDAGSGSGSGVSGMDSVAGPALQIQGCGAGHEAVAGFLAALRDIGGVTRVAVLNSDRPDPSTATGGSGATASGGSSENCATRDFISKFGIVAAFDAVEVSARDRRPTLAPADRQRLRRPSSHRDRDGAMRRNELTIVLSLAVVGMIAAFWLVVISPKRDQAAA